jgi:hypothetical protein
LSIPPARIAEPLVKAHLALWLIERGAQELTVSVDGQEPDREAIQRVLGQAGYRLEWSRGPAWTGKYDAPGRPPIEVVSRPGPDVRAVFPGDVSLVAECKGEQTAAGVKAGTDLTAFYTALGQLIVTAGEASPRPDRLLLVVPDTPRVHQFAERAARNPLVRSLRISVVAIDAAGTVTSFADYE